MWWFGNLTQEQLDAWVSSSTSNEPIKIKLKPLRCDHCKKFMSRLETYVQIDDFRYHLSKTCLQSFGNRSKHTDFFTPHVKVEGAHI